MPATRYRFHLRTGNRLDCPTSLVRARPVMVAIDDEHRHIDLAIKLSCLVPEMRMTDEIEEGAVMS